MQLRENGCDVAKTRFDTDIYWFTMIVQVFDAKISIVL